MDLADASLQKTFYGYLTYLFTDEVGDMYSWLGRKGKQAFESLEFFKRYDFFQ